MQAPRLTINFEPIKQKLLNMNLNVANALFSPLIPLSMQRAD